MCHQAHRQNKYPYASFVHVYASSPEVMALFPIVSVVVWITVFARYHRFLNLYFNWLQNTGALELNYFVFETFLLPFLTSVSRPQGLFDPVSYKSYKNEYTQYISISWQESATACLQPRYDARVCSSTIYSYLTVTAKYEKNAIWTLYKIR